MANKFKWQQMKDLDGQPIRNANVIAQCVGTGTTSVFTGKGVLLAVIVWADATGATIHFTDNDDAAISGLPNATNKGKADALGDFGIPQVELSNGLKVVLGDASGVFISVFAATDV